MWHKSKQDAVKIVIADIVAFIMVHRLAISTIENRMGGAVFWWCVCWCGGDDDDGVRTISDSCYVQ